MDLIEFIPDRCLSFYFNTCCYVHVHMVSNKIVIRITAAHYASYKIENRYK